MGDEYNPQDYPEQPSQGHPEQTSQAYPRIVQEQSPQESIKRIWLFATIFLVLIVIALGIFLFMKFSSDTISKDDLSEGTDIDLKENKEIKFEIDEEEHKLIVDAFHEDSVDVTIQSRTITANIKKGETKKFDLDDDGTYDLSIKLRSITGNKANLYIRKIDEYVCTEDWECDDWDICVDEIQTRDCEDLNDCGTTKDKPNEEQDCEEITCSEQNGTICEDTETCNETTITTSDTNECCLGSCEVEIPVMENMSDFKVKFSNCEFASIIVDPLPTITIYYEILGSEGELCKVKFRYDKHLSENYEGKEMICKLNYSLDFDDAQIGFYGDMEGCEGELWELTRPDNPQQEICNNITCENCSPGNLIYYLGECVECMYHLNCKNGFDCIRGDCVEVECISNSDCGDNKTCIDNGCKTEEEIYNEFEPCDYNNDHSNCTQPCDNCTEGNYSCMVGAWKDIEGGAIGIDLCLECLYDQSCKEGYICENFVCILE